MVLGLLSICSRSFSSIYNAYKKRSIAEAEYHMAGEAFRYFPKGRCRFLYVDSANNANTYLQFRVETDFRKSFGRRQLLRLIVNVEKKKYIYIKSLTLFTFVFHV